MQSTMATERELTLAEVAASLRVSEDTARKLVTNGEISGRKHAGTNDSRSYFAPD